MQNRPAIAVTVVSGPPSPAVRAFIDALLLNARPVHGPARRRADRVEDLTPMLAFLQPSEGRTLLRALQSHAATIAAHPANHEPGEDERVMYLTRWVTHLLTIDAIETKAQAARSGAEEAEGLRQGPARRPGRRRPRRALRAPPPREEPHRPHRGGRPPCNVTLISRRSRP